MIEKKLNGEIYRVELVGKVTAGNCPENLTEEEREKIGEPLKFTGVLIKSNRFDYGDQTALVIYEECSEGTFKYLYDTRYEAISREDPKTLRRFLKELLPKAFRVEF